MDLDETYGNGCCGEGCCPTGYGYGLQVDPNVPAYYENLAAEGRGINPMVENKRIPFSCYKGYFGSDQNKTGVERCYLPCRIGLRSKKNKSGNRSCQLIQDSADLNNAVNQYRAAYAMGKPVLAGYPPKSNTRGRGMDEYEEYGGDLYGGARKLKPCKEGSSRNPKTNRCRKVGSKSRKKSSRKLKKCKSDQYRSDKTNRCRKKSSKKKSSKKCKTGSVRGTKKRCVKLCKDKSKYKSRKSNGKLRCLKANSPSKIDKLISQYGRAGVESLSRSELEKGLLRKYKKKSKKKSKNKSSKK